MAKFVIKKDGVKELFDAKKLRQAIINTAGGVKLTKKRKDEITEKVFSAVMQVANSKEEITTSELRDKIISELEIFEPTAAKNWKEYEQKKSK